MRTKSEEFDPRTLAIEEKMVVEFALGAVNRTDFSRRFGPWLQNFLQDREELQEEDHDAIYCRAEEIVLDCKYGPLVEWCANNKIGDYFRRMITCANIVEDLKANYRLSVIQALRSPSRKTRQNTREALRDEHCARKSATSVLNRFLREQYRDRSVDPLVETEFWQDPPFDAELKFELEQAINHLAPRERAALTLDFYAGASVREIAELLRLSQANVKVILFRARKSLKKTLELKGVDSSK